MLAGMASAAVVLGFDPASGSWVTEALARGGKLGHGLPRLDGSIETDPAALTSFSTDLGNSVHKAPVAVLFPGSVRDIQEMMRFCKKHRISVAARGQGHSTFGQGLAKNGLVINMSSLNTIHSISSDCADVDAGVTWKDLVTETVQFGLTPPGLTGYTKLSIGGTLSVGGVTPLKNDAGAQVDNVRELTVVTGTGSVKVCSRHKNRELFEGALAGLGQYGIIVRAVLDLVPAQALSRTYLINYSDNATFFTDLRMLLQRGELDGMYNLWVPDGAGGHTYQLNAVKHFDAGSAPDDGHLLRGLSSDALQVIDESYLATMLRVDVQIEYLRSLGLFDNMKHPWFDVFLPDETVEQYVQEVLPALTPEDVGPFGFMLLLVLKRSELKRPLFRVPDDTEWVYLFDILSSSATPSPDAGYDERMLNRNRNLYEKARTMGGVRYPIGSLDFSHADWREHQGEQYFRFARLKKQMDPGGILTPGPGIYC
jgi:FAD/FMN-containing dehydrogenase